MGRKKAPERCCKTCKWFKPQRAKNGRRLFHLLGECAWPVPDIKWPDSLKAPWKNVGVVPEKRGVVAEQGTECEVWEAE